MAIIKCPPNVTAVTLSVTGTTAVGGDGLVTTTPQEATILNPGGAISPYGALKLISTAPNGDCVLTASHAITGMVVSGVTYTDNGTQTPWGKCLTPAFPAALATQLLQHNFKLIQG